MWVFNKPSYLQYASFVRAFQHRCENGLTPKDTSTGNTVIVCFAYWHIASLCRPPNLKGSLFIHSAALENFSPLCAVNFPPVWNLASRSTPPDRARRQTHSSFCFDPTARRRPDLWASGLWLATHHAKLTEIRNWGTTSHTHNTHQVMVTEPYGPFWKLANFMVISTFLDNDANRQPATFFCLWHFRVNSD